MQIVTGKTGTPHITSVQDRALNQGLAGQGVYILSTGQNLEPEIYSANEIHIKDGALLAQGCLAVVEHGSYDTITIANGTQGMKRKDVIAARYSYNAEKQTEAMEWVVLQGTPAAAKPVQPTVSNTGDLEAYDSTVDMPVFVVSLDGVSITSVNTVAERLYPLGNGTKLLWQGNEMLGGSANVQLAEKVSEQAHGLMLMFGLADDSSVYGDYGTMCILKEQIEIGNHQFVFDLGTLVFGTNSRKRITINDANITGEYYNTTKGTAGGITYDNSKLRLIRVYGW